MPELGYSSTSDISSEVNRFGGEGAGFSENIWILGHRPDKTETTNINIMHTDLLV